MIYMPLGSDNTEVFVKAHWILFWLMIDYIPSTNSYWWFLSTVRSDKTHILRSHITSNVTWRTLVMWTDKNTAFAMLYHDDVIKWKHFLCNWPFVRGIHRPRWIPLTKASDAEFWCFLWFAPVSNPSGRCWFETPSRLLRRNVMPNFGVTCINILDRKNRFVWYHETSKLRQHSIHQYSSSNK